MFLYKQVPAERLSGLSGNHASRGVWGSALRAKSYKSFQNHSNLFPDKMIQILKIRPISLIIPKGYVFIKQVPAERLSGLSGDFSF